MSTGKEVANWSDESMFVAEEAPTDERGDHRPIVTLIEGPSDPLGQLAYFAKAYQGVFPKGLEEITDEDRRYYIDDIEKNVLGMPAESVMFNFQFQNVTRAWTHQLVRTRHACLVGDTRVMGGSYHADRNEHNPTIRDLYENRKVAGGTKQIKIRTVNESGIIVRNKIKDIWEVGVRQVFTLKTHDGRSITATGNHPFQRPDGTFTNLEDLSVGELVMSNGIELVTDETWLREKVESGMSTAQIADLANCSTSHIKKYRRKFGFPGIGGFDSISPEQRLVNASVAGSSPQKRWSAEARQRFSEQCKRERNSRPELFSGVDPGHRAAQAMFARKYDDPCAWCGGKSEELAHVDGNPMNNDNGNVQGMCIPCHRAMDRGTYPESVYPSTIVSIEPAGEEMVYDLEMDGEYPWFVANGLVVHNSYAQESMRFAVKEDFPTQLPPSMLGTLSRREWRERELDTFPLKGSSPLDFQKRSGLEPTEEMWRQYEDGWLEYEERYASKMQRARFSRDETIAACKEGYEREIALGVPAEDARGVTPHAIVTKINMAISLRALKDMAGQRLCTQAQFEHREVWNGIRKELIRYGGEKKYSVKEYEEDGFNDLYVSYSSLWQYEKLATKFLPICYQTGSCKFGSDFDRFCSIRDRVNLNTAAGRRSDKWHLPLLVETKKPNGEMEEQVAAPAIHPSEWLDPRAAISPTADWRSDKALSNIEGRRR